VYETIVEPFAGAAGYATRYADRKVILLERDPTIAALWRYLVSVKPAEILALPDMPLEGSTVDDLPVCQEAKSLIGFWCNKGTASPHKSPSMWMRNADKEWASGKYARSNSYWGRVIREKIASQVTLIRHWQVIEASYESAPDLEATWFIDPPYEAAGKYYRFRLDSYEPLAAWCKARRGQVMVCENTGATWLPFKPFATLKSTPGTHGKSYSSEVLWTNEVESPYEAMMRLSSEDT